MSGRGIRRAAKVKGPPCQTHSANRNLASNPARSCRRTAAAAFSATRRPAAASAVRLPSWARAFASSACRPRQNFKGRPLQINAAPSHADGLSDAWMLYFAAAPQAPHSMPPAHAPVCADWSEPRSAPQPAPPPKWLPSLDGAEPRSLGPAVGDRRRPLAVWEPTPALWAPAPPAPAPVCARALRPLAETHLHARSFAAGAAHAWVTRPPQEAGLGL